jgi:hypothetical protein
MPKKVEWICNECDTGPCKTIHLYKGKGQTKFPEVLWK